MAARQVRRPETGDSRRDQIVSQNAGSRSAERKATFIEINSSQTCISFDVSKETAEEIRSMLTFLTVLSPIQPWDGVEIWSALRGAVEAAGGNADEVSGRRKVAAR